MPKGGPSSNSADPWAGLAASTVALLGMGIGNVILPPLVKRYFPDRVGPVSSLYITVLQVGTILPAVQFSGIIDPVSSLEGAGRLIGEIFPTTHFVIISRGTFSKALEFEDLWASFIPLLISAPVLIGLTAVLLRKQAR